MSALATLRPAAHARLLDQHSIDYVWQSGRLIALSPLAFRLGEWEDVTDWTTAAMFAWLGY